MSYIRLFLLFIGLMIPLQNFAVIGATSAPVKVELIQEEKTIQPGRPFWVALRFTIEEGWHVYWKNPGDAGIPLKVEWKLPTGLQAGPLKWPFPEKFNIEEMVGFGYQKEVVLLTEMMPSKTLQPGDLQLEAQVKWLVCSSLTCQPGSAPASMKIKVDAQTPQINENSIALFKETRAKLPTSHVSVQTVRKEGIVQLQVPTLDSLQDQDDVIGVYFFPEQQDVIDHSVDATLAFNQLEVKSHIPSNYVVNLKGSDQIGADTTNLKGVLVVHTQKATSQKVQAFDIDSPIQDLKDQELLSFVDIPKRQPSSLKSSTQNQGNLKTYASFEGGLGLALIFAFIGGMILNLMPCVLPVMSFKVMSFIKMSRESRSLTIKHGLMFSVGVILSFWVLASVMLLLRAYGQSVGWGFQLQEPLFVVILASLLFVFALSLFGLFELGMFVSSWAGQAEVDTIQKSSGYTSSFFSGVLATAVATPCTGPFLGSAVGFAVTLPIFQSLLIFTVLGLGMCFPYLLLAAFPSFLRFIPKPGAWMEIFKQIMGFGLLATVLWLLWVFSSQTNTLSLICLLAGFLCFSIGAWLYGKGSMPLVSKSRKILAYITVALFFVMGCQLILLPKETWSQEQSLTGHAKDDDWEVFSPERIAELQEKGIPVLVDFTAKWCLICQANHLVLSTTEVVNHLAEAGIVKMKADWTKNDPVITQELSKFGRNSVPLYVLYSPNQDKDPILLPQVLTPEIVIDHIKTAIESEHIALN